MNMNRKLIVFDWGRVLEGYDAISMCGKEFVKKVLQDISIHLSESRLDVFLEVLTENQFFETSQSMCNKNIMKAFESVDIKADGELVSNFRKSFIHNSIITTTGNCEIIKWIERHPEADYGLLSNCGELDKVRQSITAPEHLFKYVLRSCECGLAKPSVAIYLYFEKMIKHRQYDILFIDDKQDNLEVPDELGWKTFLYDGNNKELFKCLERFLVV